MRLPLKSYSLIRYFIIQYFRIYEIKSVLSYYSESLPMPIGMCIHYFLKGLCMPIFGCNFSPRNLVPQSFIHTLELFLEYKICRGMQIWSRFSGVHPPPRDPMLRCGLLPGEWILWCGSPILHGIKISYGVAPSPQDQILQGAPPPGIKSYGVPPRIESCGIAPLM